MSLIAPEVHSPSLRVDRPVAIADGPVSTSLGLVRHCRQFGDPCGGVALQHGGHKQLLGHHRPPALHRIMVGIPCNFMPSRMIVQRLTPPF
jgi:hypothetical protein